MIKKWIYLSCICIIQLLFTACEGTQVDNNIRVLVKGTVVDQQDNPLPNAHIKIYVDAVSYGSSRVLLGQGFSDDTGRFSITSLFGANDIFLITISAGDAYASYSYRTSTKSYLPEDLTFDLQTIELSKLANFNYVITKTSSEDVVFNYSFKYIAPICNVFYEDEILDNYNSYCYEETQLARQLNAESLHVDKIILVPLQSQIEFTYSINDAAPQNQTFTINSEDYAFQFNY